MLKLKLRYFGHLMRRVDSLEKILMLGGIGGRRRRARQRTRWLDGITNSMDMSWVNSGSWWWTERPGVLWFMGWQRVRHDWATELNWPEWIWNWSMAMSDLVRPGSRLLHDAFGIMICNLQAFLISAYILTGSLHMTVRPHYHWSHSQECFYHRSKFWGDLLLNPLLGLCWCDYYYYFLIVHHYNLGSKC